MSIKQLPNRRDILVGGTALAAAGLGNVSSAQDPARSSANGRLKIAAIGVGGRGGANLRTMEQTGLVDVVAVCDVDTRFTDQAILRHPKAKAFRDFRKLYDIVGNDIDGVVVSTTEHTHAFATMPALQLGKHVYCEKPLAYNIDETRKIAEAAERAGVVTQMGTQIHAGNNYHRVVELIQSGAIGDVSEAHVWVNRAWGLHPEAAAENPRDPLHVDSRPTDAMTSPDHVDWDLWLGPAP
ncbi:Gfo/Idh/MocA family protein, partial [Rhodopirellula bahusiensis]|uniref:Gfo/Idh/MocA family protein n=1 Tax=Rhodopirellula bahusiensis TaxID=2014065 RepID=UPI003263FEFF